MAPTVAPVAHRVVTRALTWLHTHRELGAFPPDTTAELAEPDTVYKPLGESALAASLVLREGVAGAEERRMAHELLDFAWEQLGEGTLLHERVLRYPMMTDPLETYVHFSRSGYRHAELERVLTHTMSLRSVRAEELVANRRMAVANAVRVSGLGAPAATDWDALLRQTWLGSTPEPWLIDWMTAYYVTHSVFHATDWGARPDGLPPDVVDYLDTWVPVWQDIWWEIGEWDLVAELMIVGSSLPRPLVSPRYWERLASVQHDDGLVPRDARTRADDPAQRFAAHQHTTVVAVVAGTLAVSRSLEARA